MDTLLGHIKELRKRLIISTIATGAAAIIIFTCFPYIIPILLNPFKNIASQSPLYTHSLFEGFLVKIKVSCIGGLLLASPIHLFHIIRFIFPGLTKKEKKVILWSLLSSIILVLGSIYMVYTILIPFSIDFLTSSSFVPEPIGILLNYNKNIFYILNFLMYGILIFQLPILLELLLYFNLISRKTLLKNSRYVIVGIFVTTALVTPPDIVSQVGLALPLITLYFLTILIAKCFKFGE